MLMRCVFGAVATVVMALASRGYAILLDFQLSMLLYQRFELLRDTLAAEPVRFKSSRSDWMRLMPEEPWDKITTRMETLQALLRKQKENPAHK